ncbi:nitrous oxide reductase family maturation protein NosD [Halorientalis brevis]|uniref:Nitrous oxide reductase family maturation protein NosD n=1 Tax=Halorientalis brevis TaxID=1126241 RepID=A0ABD6CCP6_9EURY|nr:nitrous oxide reductase family maturation protein NosD [Halorientalis brevis]
MSSKSPHLERGFALLAVGLLVLTVATAGALGTASRTDSSVAFQPPVPDEYEFTSPSADGVARVDGTTYETVGAAVEAARPGDVVHLRGRFDERVVVRTPNVTLAGAGPDRTVVDGNGSGDVLTIEAGNVTVRDLWVRNGGYSPSDNDAGIWVNASNATVVDARVTNMTFGVWLDGGRNLRVSNNTIIGRESVTPLSKRGNGIHIWKVTDAVITNNRITDVRDGVYYSWASNVTASENVLWDIRYGIHYMYSDDCTLRENLAFDNDIGYALMVSKQLHIVDNTAINNSGQSSHGILLKGIDDTEIRNNTLVDNGNGQYVFNSMDNNITGNLHLANDVGIHLTAGSVRERVHHNSFIGNGEQVRPVIGEQVAWNASSSGNYWASARTADVDGDSVSELRYQPAGLVEQLVVDEPAAGLFVDSPAFHLIRLAESSVPVIESPGVVDHHPLVDSPHEDWRRFYERR